MNTKNRAVNAKGTRYLKSFRAVICQRAKRIGIKKTVASMNTGMYRPVGGGSFTYAIVYGLTHSTKSTSRCGSK